MTQPDEIKEWLCNPEGRHLEFKKASGGFSIDKDLPDYCAALANEGGGKLILIPGTVYGIAVWKTGRLV